MAISISLMPGPYDPGVNKSDALVHHSMERARSRSSAGYCPATLPLDSLVGSLAACPIPSRRWSIDATPTGHIGPGSASYGSIPRRERAFTSRDKILCRTPRAMLPCLRTSGRTSWSFQALHMSDRTAQRVISPNSLNSQRYGAGDLKGSRGMISGSRFVAMSTMRGYPRRSPS